VTSSAAKNNGRYLDKLDARNFPEFMLQVYITYHGFRIAILQGYFWLH